mgnify:CR=1 FL=1
MIALAHALIILIVILVNISINVTISIVQCDLFFKDHTSHQCAKRMLNKKLNLIKFLQI